MLARYNGMISENADIKIEKYINGEPASRKGTVKSGDTLRIELTLSRRLGDGGVVLRIARDGEADRDLPFTFFDSEAGKDRYFIELCPIKGLYYWEILLVRGADTLFINSVNQVDHMLVSHSESRFRLLCYDEGAKRPEWL